MLVLYRKPNERIMIGTQEQIDNGEAIVITALEKRSKSQNGNHIGIDAPKEILIVREELLTRNETVNRKEV